MSIYRENVSNLAKELANHAGNISVALIMSLKEEGRKVGEFDHLIRKQDAQYRDFKSNKD